MRKSIPICVLILMSMFATAVQAEPLPFTIHTTGVISSSFVEDVYTPVRPPWSEPIANEGVLPGWQEGSSVLGVMTPTGPPVVEDQIWKLFFDIEGRVTSYDDAGVEEGRFDYAGSGVQAVDVNPDHVLVDEEAGILRQVFGTYRLLGEPLVTAEITEVTGTFEQNPPVGELLMYSSGWVTVEIIPGLDLEENMFPAQPQLAFVYTTASTGHYIPEPSTLASLLSVGVVGLLAYRLRRGRSRRSAAGPTPPT